MFTTYVELDIGGTEYQGGSRRVPPRAYSSPVQVFMINRRGRQLERSSLSPRTALARADVPLVALVRVDCCGLDHEGFVVLSGCQCLHGQSAFFFFGEYLYHVIFIYRTSSPEDRDTAAGRPGLGPPGNLKQVRTVHSAILRLAGVLQGHNLLRAPRLTGRRLTAALQDLITSAAYH